MVAYPQISGKQINVLHINQTFLKVTLNSFKNSYNLHRKCLARDTAKMQINNNTDHRRIEKWLFPFYYLPSVGKLKFLKKILFILEKVDFTLWKNVSFPDSIVSKYHMFLMFFVTDSFKPAGVFFPTQSTHQSGRTFFLNVFGGLECVSLFFVMTPNLYFFHIEMPGFEPRELP